MTTSHERIISLFRLNTIQISQVFELQTKPLEFFNTFHRVIHHFNCEVFIYADKERKTLAIQFTTFKAPGCNQTILI